MATTTPRIVIVGAGVVGCSLADELTRRGHRAVTVLHRGALHDDDSVAPDPGLVLQVSSSRLLTRLAVATRSAYAGLRDGGVPVLTRAGGLELATTPERLDDLHRRHGWATAAGIDSRMLEPAECATVHPLLDKDRVLGGLHVPTDGTVDPLAAARARARAATGRGAVVLEHRTVTAIERSGDRVTGVRCDDEYFPAEIVISCAGVVGPAVGELAGAPVPLVPVVRQYVTTDALATLETIHALEAASGRANPALPVLRQADAGVRVRTHGHRIGIGAAPLRPRAIEAGGAGGAAARRFVPEDFDRAWDATAELLPLLADSKVAEGVDAVVAGTPDGMPLLGEHPDLGGFWTAEAVRTAHAAGVAEAVAEWITTGRPSLGGEPVDLGAADVARVDPAAAPAPSRSCRPSGTTRGVRHPHDPPDPARPIRTTPFHSRQVELRAVVAEVDGVESPLWFEANASLPEVCEVDRRTGWAARNWSPVAGAEALVTRRAAGMVDLSPVRRVEVTGPDAAGFLQRLVTGDVDRAVGHVVPTLMLDAGGGVLADPVVTRLGPHRFLVGVAERRDVAVLRRYARPGVEITDVTGATACLGVWGPAADEILRELVPEGARRPAPHRAAEFAVGTVPVTGLRISCIGEDGWELVCAAADAERLWDTVHAAGARHGLVPVGRHAVDSLRLEAGHRTRGPEISPEHGPDAVGLASRVDLDKGPFVGRAAVHAARAAGAPARTLATLVLDHSGAVLHGREPVHDLPEPRRYSRDPVRMDPVPDLRRGPVIGRVTVAATGYTTGVAAARAWLPTARAVPGTRVEIEQGGRRLTARVVAEPLQIGSIIETAPFR